MRVTNLVLVCSVGVPIYVSIPYMRVTNEAKVMAGEPIVVSFNPLYAGHKPSAPKKAGKWIPVFQSPICGSQTTMEEAEATAGTICFNPLYAGHKQRD